MTVELHYSFVFKYVNNAYPYDKKVNFMTA